MKVDFGDIVDVPRPPVEDWFARNPDAWLEKRVMAHADGPTEWSRGVAAGLFGRAQRLDTAKVMSSLLKGQVAPEADLAWSWARSLEPGSVQTLVDLANIVITRMEETLSDLLSDLEGEVDFDDWRATWSHLKMDRDEVASVLRLLREHGRTGSVISLDEFDAEASMVAVAVGGVCEGELWERIGVGEPDAWWARG